MPTPRTTRSAGGPAFGGQLMDDKGKCIADTTGVADAYKYFQDLQTAGAKWYDKYDDLASDFKAGKISLIVDGPWASGGYKDALKANLAVARCRPVRRARRSR